MGRATGQPQTAVGALGPDGSIYRRGRRQRSSDVLVVPPNIDPILQSLANQLYGEPAGMLLATHAPATSSEELAALLADGNEQLIAYIAAGQSWTVDLSDISSRVDLHLLGEGTVTLIGHSPGSGSTIEAHGTLKITFKRGSLKAYEKCYVSQTGEVTDLTLHDQASATINGFGCYCELRDNATAVLQQARTVLCKDDSNLHLDENDPSAAMVRVEEQAVVHGPDRAYNAVWLRQYGHTTGDPLQLGRVSVAC